MLGDHACREPSSAPLGAALLTSPSSSAGEASSLGAGLVGPSPQLSPFPILPSHPLSATHLWEAQDQVTYPGRLLYLYQHAGFVPEPDSKTNPLENKERLQRRAQGPCSAPWAAWPGLGKDPLCLLPYFSLCCPPPILARDPRNTTRSKHESFPKPNSPKSPGD